MRHNHKNQIILEARASLPSPHKSWLKSEKSLYFYPPKNEKTNAKKMKQTGNCNGQQKGKSQRLPPDLKTKEREISVASW